MASRRTNRLILVVAAVIVVAAVVSGLVVGLSRDGDDGRRPDLVVDASRIDSFGDDAGDVVWSADGSTLYRMHPERIEVITGSPLASAHDIQVAPDRRLAVWSPDRTRVALWFRDGTATIVDVTDGSTVTTLTGGREYPIAAWSPDGTRLAFDTGDHEIAVASATTGVTERSWDPSIHTLGDSIQAIGWIDETRIASASYTWTAVSDADTGEIIWRKSSQPGDVMAVSPDGLSIAVSQRDSRSQKVYAAADGTQLGAVELETSHALSFSWSPDSAWLLATADDDRPKLWDATAHETRDEYPEYAPYGAGASWAPDSQRIAIPDNYDQRILVTDVTGAVGDDDLWIDDDQVLVAVRWSPRGDRLVALGRGGDLFVWDMAI